MKKMLKIVAVSILTVLTVTLFAEAKSPKLKYANSWILLSEGESPNITKSDISTSWTNAPFNKVDMLYIAFGHTIIKDGIPTFELYDSDPQINTQIHENFKWLLKNAKLKNEKIKLLISLGWNKDDLSGIFIDNGKNVDKYAESVASFVKKNKLSGFDIDWEGPVHSQKMTITKEQFITLANAIRKALDEQGKYLFTISPATTTSLDATTINKDINFVNLQSYNNNQELVDQFKAMNISNKKMLYGICTETGYWNDVESGYKDALKNKLIGTFTWRLNSDNWNVSEGPRVPKRTPEVQGEQTAQIALYNLVHKIN